MKRAIWVWLCLFAGCDDGDGGALGDGGLEGDMRPPIGSVCDIENLTAQCPPGSLPIVDEERVRVCDSETEVTTDGGTVTGVCRTREACTFICNFSDPCPCGIARITDEGVFCAECVTACGDAKCQGAEDPERCPIDCAERCPADAERCNGDHREVCEDTGLWTTLTCRSDQRCTFAPDPVNAGITLCETRVGSGGGTFPGLGRWHPVGDVDYAAVRFPAADLPVLPMAFQDDGRLLALEAAAQRLVHLDPAEPATLTQIGGALPTTIESRFGLHRAAGFAVARGRYAGQDQVWDLDDAAGTRLLADFGGLPTSINDLTGLTRGQWAISPDGDTVAHALSVGFDGRVFTTIIIWDARTGEVRTLLRYAEPQFGVEQGDLPEFLALNGDGTGLVAGYPQADGILLIRWDIAARQHARPILSTIMNPTQFALSRAGDDRLAISNGRRTVVWDLGAEQRLAVIEQGSDHIAFTPDGRSIVIGDTQFGVADGQMERELPGDGAVLFDPTAPRLVVGRRIYDEGR